MPKLKRDTQDYVEIGFSANEVELYNRDWPGSRLPNAPISFEFSKKTGDLVDINSSRSLRRAHDSGGFEFRGLAEDA